MPFGRIKDVFDSVRYSYQYANDRQRRFMLGVFAVCGLVLLNLIWAVAARIFPRQGNEYGVIGTASVGGELIKTGELVLDPTVGEDAKRRSVRIINGSFELAANQGIMKDRKYTVRVYGYRQTGRKYQNADPDQSAEEQEQFIAEDFNSASKTIFEATPTNLRKHLTLDLPASAILRPQPIKSGKAGKRK